MTPVVWAAFVAAGSAGAVVRYVVDRAAAARAGGAFPWGTFLVNVSGSLVLGLLAGWARHHGLAEAPRVVLGVGFCGAYTTFSTHTVETVRLLEDRALAAAARNIAGTLAAAVGAAAVGLALAAAVP